MSNPSYQRGDVVWATVTDQQGGNQKGRPLVIITPTVDIQPESPLQVVCISTKDYGPPQVQVELPWQADGRAKTGLVEESVAVCTWIRRLLPEEIERRIGAVPGRQLLEILRKVKSLSPHEYPGD